LQITAARQIHKTGPRRFRLPVFLLTFPAVVAHGPHGGLEVGRCLLLDLVGQVVDLEPIEPEKKIQRMTESLLEKAR
jgi:hypothetical protein